MKLFPFFFLLCISLHTKSQTSVGVTMNGIGNLKIGMKLVDVEKLAGAPLKLNNILKTTGISIQSPHALMASTLNSYSVAIMPMKKYDVTLREVSSSDSSLKPNQVLQSGMTNSRSLTLTKAIRSGLFQITRMIIRLGVKQEQQFFIW